MAGAYFSVQIIAPSSQLYYFRIVSSAFFLIFNLTLQVKRSIFDERSSNGHTSNNEEEG
jgi:hypothetical protein